MAGVPIAIINKLHSACQERNQQRRTGGVPAGDYRPLMERFHECMDQLGVGGRERNLLTDAFHGQRSRYCSETLVS